jgi:hypothetical protein
MKRPTEPLAALLPAQAGIQNHKPATNDETIWTPTCVGVSGGCEAVTTFFSSENPAFFVIPGAAHHAVVRRRPGIARDSNDPGSALRHCMPQRARDDGDAPPD